MDLLPCALRWQLRWLLRWQLSRQLASSKGVHYSVVVTRVGRHSLWHEALFGITKNLCGATLYVIASWSSGRYAH